MKIEEQVCSLGLSKKLKELKVKQESLFYWEREVDNDYKWHISFGAEDWNESQMDNFNVYSAFTVAELGEMLPQGYFSYLNLNNHWQIGETRDGKLENFWAFSANTEVDIRAKMLIYLLENNLMGEKK